MPLSKVPLGLAPRNVTSASSGVPLSETPTPRKDVFFRDRRRGKHRLSLHLLHLVAFQTARELFRPSAGNAIAPLAAASVQDTLPHRPQVFGDRGVASCDVSQLFKPPKGSPAQAPATAWCSLPQ
jgi:hypothetical protein